MSRPIPEGVVVPHPNAVILGFGGDFKVPKDGFHGWIRSLQQGSSWMSCHGHGLSKFSIYAADRDSEVARLNTNPTQISNSLVDTKDALIREMIVALQGIRSTSTDGLSFALYSATVRDQCKKALTLARTTCPEALE